MESIILIPIAVRLHGCCAESNHLLLVYVCNKLILGCRFIPPVCGAASSNPPQVLPQALEISAPTVPALAENVVIPLPNPARRFTSKSLITSYQRNINGFAAYLSQEEQQKLAGEDLSDLAVEYSICPSKEEGGMLGWVPEFEEAAFTAPLNKVVKCKTQFGWEESVLEDIQPEVSFKIARSGKYLIYNILKLALVALSPPPTVREGVSLLLELIAIHDSMMVPA
ncbi:hypothetical protein L1887_06769 [Cichorium endivia]|nr:hypothetical protein L1887_06769 [Cichorium endivia]